MNRTQLFRRFSVCGGWRFFLPALLLAALGCERTPSAPVVVPLPVTVAKPIVRGGVIDFETETGRLVPAEEVTVRPKVGGTIDRVTFQQIKSPAADGVAAPMPVPVPTTTTPAPVGTQPPAPSATAAPNYREGETVLKDAVLFEIDPRIYKARKDAAEAEVERYTALAIKAKNDRERADVARKINITSVSELQYDELQSNEATAAAGLKSANAALEIATRHFEWTKVRAEFTGRVGPVLLSAGNVVTADVTPLTTIVREDPIYVEFDLSGQTVLRYQAMIREGAFDSVRSTEMPIWIGLDNEAGYPHRGVLELPSNQLNESTGTLRLRGVFDNPLMAEKLRLFTPGLWVHVRIPASRPYEALMISERAITTNLGRKVVYVVDDQNIAHRREVSLGTLHDGLRVITGGLKPDERIVVVGVQRVRDGAPVKAEEKPMPVETPLPERKPELPKPSATSAVPVAPASTATSN